MESNEITGEIINCAIKVHKTLGPGLLESVYEKCLAYELSKRGLKVEVQKEMPIVYEEIVFDKGYRIDLLVEDSVVVELKSVSEMKPIYSAQTLTYLKLAKLKVALLRNSIKKWNQKISNVTLKLRSTKCTLFSHRESRS